MKIQLLFCLVPMALMSLFTGCKKDSYDPNSEFNNSNQFTAVVNGKPWHGFITSATLLDHKEMVLEAMGIDNSKFTINIKDTKVNIFDISNAAAGNITYSDSTLGKLYSNFSSGSCNVASFDTVTDVISGTFGFKVKKQNGQDSIFVTDGLFSRIKFTEVQTRTLDVNMNEAPFSAYFVNIFEDKNTGSYVLEAETKYKTVSVAFNNTSAGNTIYLNTNMFNNYISYTDGVRNYVSVNGTIFIKTYDPSSHRITGTFTSDLVDKLTNVRDTIHFSNGNFSGYLPN